ncbi:alpha-mannosidase [Buttiauxella sp. 3AFRM03]|uniref:glycoside hydrolase family 38 N-terminal domain-containing protein n=1 Tax=Buttiauxella sp. 3AFRM03 TaxID=2479367 RepID=UPI000EF78763|nr:glycoside hydrolase family 38 C-terminal domain-containing protein [Buttiauxella sp. 3AFRM03]AYN28756.1 alpha-mannosidase [Buttiauxella sp. 3AFRM03]
MTRIHVIPHTHWDQEWYFTHQDSSVLASYNFIEVLRTLSDAPDYAYYHLDGQTAIVEDFLAIKPDYRNLLQQLVSDKRLFIGPWYTQTDTYNVHGESIIRNLKYGITFARSLGHAMKVGYLPDTFGHNAQMPTLLRGCGLDNLVFWRGIDHDTQVPRSQFWWQAPSGATILACSMPYGYGAAKNIQATSVHLEQKIFPMVEQIKQRSGLADVLLPCGGDQVNIDPNLPQILAQASASSLQQDEWILSSLEQFIDAVRPQCDAETVWQGELKAPRYTRIHKTIGSVRYDIKKRNYDIEQFLLRKLEPVVAIARNQGISVNTEWVDNAWKTILRSHAHDSMGGCNSDATNQDIVHRLKQAEQVVHSLWNLVVKELAFATCREGDFLIFNTRASIWSGTVEATLYTVAPGFTLTRAGQPLAFSVIEKQTLSGGKTVQLTPQGEQEVAQPSYYRWRVAIETVDLPALGYAVVQVNESPSQLIATTVKKATAEIQNQHYCLSLENAKLKLVEKKTGRIIESLLALEDCADAGDSYDFSPLAGDVPIAADNFTLLSCETQDHFQRLTLRTTLALPANLAARQGKEQHAATLPVTVVCELHHDNPHLFIHVELTNTVCDHRLRLVINSDIHTSHSLASQPFSMIARPLNNHPHGWQHTLRENPVDIETSDGIIAIEQPGKALVINSMGMKEFQVLESSPNRVALTLFKATGVLGRDDLEWRPGRASGINNTVVETPDAQLLQPLRFSLALALTDNARHLTLRQLEADAIHQPFCYQRQALNTTEHRLERFALRFSARLLAPEFSLITLPDSLFLSAIPHSLTTDGTVIRAFNATDDDVALPPELLRHRQVNYLEEKVAPASYIAPANTVDFLVKVHGELA